MSAERVEDRIRGEAVVDRTRIHAQTLLRTGSVAFDRFLADVVAIGILLAIAAALTATVVVPVQSFMRGDWPTFFFPTYAFLGERLRAFDIPGWNPHQFSGVPFAGDPESGWTYLPAMLLYGLLPAEAATVVFIGVHIALAGLATYVLARLLGLSVAGSFVAGAAYSLTWVMIASSHMVLWFQVTIWLLVCLAAAELAARAKTWSRRLWAWLLGGVSISQILAAWLGQGAYYALLVICLWIAFRTLAVPMSARPMHQRAKNALITGSGLLGSGLALSAAGLLPRIDSIARSSLAGGAYAGSSAWADRQIGFTTTELVREVLGGYTGTLWWYAGATATALALMAPIVARRWLPVTFLTLLALGSLVLALTQTTPLHTALNFALPFFERLHEHSRERILILYPLAVALLAGATVTYLPKRHNAPILLLVAAVAPLLLAAILGVSPDFVGLVSRETLAIIIATCMLIVTLALFNISYMRWGVLAAVVILVLWDPAGRIALRGFVDESHLERSLNGSLTQDADAFLHANGAASFIAAATQTAPGRYAGYDPALLDDPSAIGTNSPELGYRNALKEPHVNRLLVFNWATWFGLEDVQGYNPVQIQRYVEYIDALNGHRQEYHERDVFPAGIGSPLLDLINLRYLVVPHDAPPSPELTGMPTVYEDQHVRILENAETLPRAWLVYEARQVAPGDALSLLADGSVDPFRTALLESVPPPLEAAPEPTLEVATYLRYEPDRIDVQVTAQAPALLVLSEVWDPGWSATVDGQQAPVLLTNHILRAVPVPAGQHLVVLDYHPPLLRLGLVVTAATTLLLAGTAAWPWAQRRVTRAAKSDDEL
ncbi:MAG: YfhO family protein [Thermomicrobiales bacterium]